MLETTVMHDDAALQFLLVQLGDGDVAAAEAVFLTYEPYLRKVVRRQLPGHLRARFDSIDVVQSVWVDLLQGFRAAGWRFSSVTHLRAFLVRHAEPLHRPHSPATDVTRARARRRRRSACRWPAAATATPCEEAEAASFGSGFSPCARRGTASSCCSNVRASLPRRSPRTPVCTRKRAATVARPRAATRVPGRAGRGRPARPATAELSHVSHFDSAIPAASADSLSEQLAAEMARRWRLGERPSAEDFLDRHPELWINPKQPPT